MKLVLLIASICVFVIAGILGVWVHEVNLSTVLGLECFALAGFASSFLPIP